MSVDKDIEALILAVVQQDGYIGLDELIARVRQSTARATRPARIRSRALKLVAAKKLEWGGSWLRLPRKPNGLLPAAKFVPKLVQEMWPGFDTATSDNDQRLLAQAIDRAFRAGVKEGRHRQLRDLRRYVTVEEDATHTHRCPGDDCEVCE